MKVSVVVCAWNAARTIREATQSALAQSHADLELIVVDDGSSDGTLGAIADLPDPRIRRHRFERAGPAAARNRGLRDARGELVAFLDADDLWHPSKLARQVEALRAAPDAAVAYCWVDRIAFDGTGREVHARETHHGDVYARLLVANFVGNGSNLLVRRTALDDVGPFDETLEAAEDWELNVRLAARHRFVCVAEPLVLYRQTPGSITSDLRRLERAFRRASRKIFAAAPAEHRHLARDADLAFYDFLANKACRDIRTRRQALAALGVLGRTALRYRRDDWQPWRRRAWRANLAVALDGLRGTRRRGSDIA